MSSVWRTATPFARTRPRACCRKSTPRERCFRKSSGLSAERTATSTSERACTARRRDRRPLLFGLLRFFDLREHGSERVFRLLERGVVRGETSAETLELFLLTDERLLRVV